MRESVRHAGESRQPRYHRVVSAFSYSEDMSESNATPDDASATPGHTHRALTDDELAILAFERQWWKEPGVKDVKMKQQFGWSATQYYQRLNALIDEPAALEADAVLVNRLLRRRQSRRRQV